MNITRRFICQTVLTDDVLEGHFECVKILTEAGADVNSTTDGWGTTLNSAACLGNIEIAKLLLRVGINLYFRNE